MLRADSRGRTARLLAAMGVGLALLSSCVDPVAPGGFVLVTVTDLGGSGAGVRIEVRGTTFSRTTDANGQALFRLPQGSYVVRALALSGPGPGRLNVDKDVTVRQGQVSKVEFSECSNCR